MITKPGLAALLFSCLAVAMALRALADAPAAAKKPAAAAADKNAAPPVLVSISKETTYLTKPLRKDGYVDYIAALDERCHNGVTPQNNAAVLMWQAVGPAAIEAGQRNEYFQRLGIAPLAETGPYFVSADEYIQKHANDRKPGGPPPNAKKIQAAQDFWDNGMPRPWSSDEFPILADWLAANSKPLGLALEASTRPRRYDPLIGGQRQLVIAMLLPAVSEYRGVAKALAARAKLRIRQGKIEAAWMDLLAVHRLARLLGQGATLVDRLVAMTVDGIAQDGDRAILQHTRLSTAAAKKMQGDLESLSPMPKMTTTFDQEERFCFLDSVTSIARDGFASVRWAVMGARENESPLERELIRAVAMTVDWDVMLRLGNSWYDRMADACGKPSRAERQRALAKVDADFRRISKSIWDVPSLIFPLLVNPRRAISRRFGELLLSLLLPSYSNVSRAEDRWAMRADITKLGFALAIYRADRGSYPAKLAELVPKYAAEIPKDIFNDRELHYKPDGDGYLLYSVGPNGIDDGGLGPDDCKNGEDWDDLALRVPDSGTGR